MSDRCQELRQSYQSLMARAAMAVGDKRYSWARRRKLYQRYLEEAQAVKRVMEDLGCARPF